MSKHSGSFSSGAARVGAWVLLAVVALLPLQAQYLPAVELDNLVSRIALYPDPLLAQVLTASTYYDQIPDAAAYSNEFRHLQGDDLARQIEADNLMFDPSVQALLPFPSVLETMASDLNWTQALGNAVLDARPEVMDAVQRMRRQAHGHGYLRDCPQYRVVYTGGWIEILPVHVGAIYVPVYDPHWIYARPRPGVRIGITFGHGIFIGAAFTSFGWRSPRFDWRERTWFIDNHRWDRSRANHVVYVHTYREPFRGGAAHSMRGGPGGQYRPGGADRGWRGAPGGPGVQVNRPGEPDRGWRRAPAGPGVQQNRPGPSGGREMQQNRPGPQGGGNAPYGGREMQQQNRPPSGIDRSNRGAWSNREMQRSQPGPSGGNVPSGGREMQQQNRPSGMERGNREVQRAHPGAPGGGGAPSGGQDRGGREASGNRESRGAQPGTSDRGDRKAPAGREQRQGRRQ